MEYAVTSSLARRVKKQGMRITRDKWFSTTAHGRIPGGVFKAPMPHLSSAENKYPGLGPCPVLIKSGLLGMWPEHRSISVLKTFPGGSDQQLEQRTQLQVKTARARVLRE
jgi:hypothetical protein